MDHKSGEVLWAGAISPVWISKQGSTGIEIVRGDRQSICYTEAPIEYTEHTLDVSAGDTIYMFSDGYADQFGGEKGKKFKSRNLLGLLQSVQGVSMDAQQKALEDNFNQWRGSFDQIDDICFIGIKL